MKSMADRFRDWYEYERDCNAKTIAMLESVPAEKRGTPEFQRSIDKMAHLVSARRRWLNRVGHWPDLPAIFPKGTRCEELPKLIADTEAAWVAYLRNLTDQDLVRTFEWHAVDGKRYRWDVEGMLTQVFGHAWYHRGQIATLVADLGGKAVDTDFIFWCKLAPLDTPA